MTRSFFFMSHSNPIYLGSFSSPYMLQITRVFLVTAQLPVFFSKEETREDQIPRVDAPCD